MEYFNLIANCCGIIGLFIAFKQLWDVKKQISQTQNTIKDMYEVLAVNEINVIIKQVSLQAQKLFSLTNSLTQYGTSNKKVLSQLCSIINELHKIEIELLSTKYNKVRESIAKALEALIEAKDNIDDVQFVKNKMLDGDSFLKISIQDMQNIVEQGFEKQIELISKANKS